MKKQHWDEVFEPLLDAAHKIGRNLADHQRKMKEKVSEFLGDLNAVDRPQYDGMGHVSPLDSARRSSDPAVVPFPDPAPPFNRAHPELADQALVDRFDATTSPDGAVFWSGRTADGGSSMDKAAAYAHGNDGMTLEQLLEQQGMTNDMPNDWSDPRTIATWQAISEKLAANANGDVTAVHGEVRDTSVWNSVEFPALVRNDAVTSITVVDANTGGAVKVYER